MSETTVVPMPSTSFVSADDICAELTKMRMGERLTMDFARDLIPRIGGAALESAAVELGRVFVHRHQHEVDAKVREVLADTEWFRAKVEEAISRYVREEIRAMFALAEPQEESDG